MKAEQRRIARLRRLERIRDIAKQALAAETAQAEGILAHLLRLNERTRGMSRDYLARDDAANGYELRETGRFASGMLRMAASTRARATDAQVLADRKMAELAAAERKRAAVADRIDLAERLAAKSAETPTLDARRQFGTGLE